MTKEDFKAVTSYGPKEHLSKEDFQGIQKFKSVVDGEWKLKRASKKTDFKVYWMHSEASPIVMIKGECTIEATPEDVLCFLHDPVLYTTNMKVLDTMFMRGDVLEARDPKHFTVYGAFAVPKPGWSRDFVYSIASTKLENGDCVLLSRSVEHPDKPAVGGLFNCVRGEIGYSGYYMERLPDVDGRPRCKACYVVQADPKGWLPTPIINMCAKDQATNIKRLRNHFAGRDADEGEECQPASPN